MTVEDDITSLLELDMMCLTDNDKCKSHIERAEQLLRDLNPYDQNYKLNQLAVQAQINSINTRMSLNEQLHAKDEQLQKTVEQLQTKNEELQETKQQLQLTNGSFFLSLQQVWETAKSKEWTQWDKTNLNRSSDSSDGYDVEPGYLATTKFAADNTFDVACSVKSSGSQSAMEERFDIFGNSRSWSQSAHLVPNSKTCSTWWFPIVPWVFDISKKLKTTATADQKWKFLQKSIHGSSKIYEDNETQRNESDSNTDGSAGQENLATANPKGTAKGKGEAKPKGNSRRENYTGIKHLDTNRIQLLEQRSFYDNTPGLFIIPLLDLNDLTSWNGTDYEAIVLAAKTQKEEAATIYEFSGACTNIPNEESLATAAELDMATNLMKECIFCNVKSLHDDFSTFKTFLEKNDHFTSVKESLEKMVDDGAPYPIMANLNDSFFYHGGLLKVRKIQLSAKHGNKIPHPMMLLEKGVSNWLKLKERSILPGCGGKIIDEYLDFNPNSFQGVDQRPALIEIPYNRFNIDDDDSVLTM